MKNYLCYTDDYMYFITKEKNDDQETYVEYGEEGDEDA